MVLTESHCTLPNVQQRSPPGRAKVPRWNHLPPLESEVCILVTVPSISEAYISRIVYVSVEEN